MARHDQRVGLRRLLAAVGSMTTIQYLPKQKPETRARTTAFCHLILPEDTYESFASRHPEWGTVEQVRGKVARMRKYVSGLRSNTHQSLHEVAQRYLASLPEHLRRTRND